MSQPFICACILLLAPVSIASSQRWRRDAAEMTRQHDEHAHASPSPLLGVRSPVGDQLVMGTLVSALVGLSAYWIMPEGMSDTRTKGDASFSPTSNSVFVAGAFVGAVAGVYSAGRSRDQNGTLAATALGASLVALPVFIIGRSDPLFPYALFAMPLQAVGATVGFQTSRRIPDYRE